MDEYCTLDNIIRNCNKVFVPFKGFQFSPGDTVFVAPHYIYYIHLYYGGIHCPDVTFVTVGFDYPMESTIKKNSMEFILNHPYLKEWIVDNTCIEDHPKLRRVCCIYNNPEYIIQNAERLAKQEKIDDVFYNFDVSKNTHERDKKLLTHGKFETIEEYYETMSKYKYVYCPNGRGPKSDKIAEVIALGSIPLVKVPKNASKMYKNFNVFCSPGLSMYYYSSEHEPVFIESPLILEDESKKNSLELLRMPDDLKNYKMSTENAREILREIRKMTDELYLTFRVSPWNGEVYYGQHIDTLYIKNNPFNNL